MIDDLRFMTGFSPEAGKRQIQGGKAGRSRLDGRASRGDLPADTPPCETEFRSTRGVPKQRDCVKTPVLNNPLRPSLTKRPLGAFRAPPNSVVGGKAVPRVA